MNLKLEEQTLIKDIFNVSVNQVDSSLLYLPEFAKDVSQFGGTSTTKKIMLLWFSTQHTSIHS